MTQPNRNTPPVSGGETATANAAPEAVVSMDLAGVIVGDTAISHVDGAAGRLLYRGTPIDQLVSQRFLQVVWLLIYGRLPSAEQEQQLADFMALHGRLQSEEISLLKSVPRDLHPMLMLQGVVPLLSSDGDGDGACWEDKLLPGLIVAAKIPALIAAWYRLQQGQEIIPSTPGLSVNENFLLMFHGRVPSADQLKILDAVQILQMEHSFNASTFAGRVCASTLAPIQSCIAASIGTLFGVLHGGADQAALEMALSIGSVDAAAPYVKQCLQRDEKIMGMGHREYKTLDPRAKILKSMATDLFATLETPQDRQLLDVLMEVESVCQQQFAQRGQEIWANVEFYKGAVFHALGVPTQYFTALFAMARVYGYIAHYREFSANSRLIRPRARYVGR